MAYQSTLICQVAFRSNLRSRCLFRPLLLPWHTTSATPLLLDFRGLVMPVDMCRRMRTCRSRTSPIPVDQPIQGKLCRLRPTRACLKLLLLSNRGPNVKKFLHLSPSTMLNMAMIARFTPSLSNCGTLKAGPHASCSSKKHELMAPRRAMTRNISFSNSLDTKIRPTAFRTTGAPSMMFPCATPAQRTFGTCSRILLLFYLPQLVRRLTPSRLPTWRWVCGTSYLVRVAPSISKAWWMNRPGGLLS